MRTGLAVGLLVGGALASAAWADEGKFSAPKNFTLALGDSLAFGYQQAKVNANPFDLAQFHTGFAFVFAQRVAQTAPGGGVALLNLGCPGETTGSFLDGSCVYRAAGFPLHIAYTGSQMAAAEALLRQHRGQVSPILISLGANDVLAVVNACGPALDFACVAALLPGALGVVQQNLGQVLGRLRAAAPDAEIVLLQLYNPLALLSPATNTLATSLNAVIGGVAAAHRARVANAFPTFNETGPQPATLCVLTLMCTPLQDIHLSDAGNAVVAELLFRASGYERFEH